MAATIQLPGAGKDLRKTGRPKIVATTQTPNRSPSSEMWFLSAFVK
jgi:hypothetical protein